MPYRLVVSGSKVYTITLHKTMLKGFKIHVSSFDLATGKAFGQYSLNSDSDVFSQDDIAYAGETGLPLVAWTSSASQTLKANVLGSKIIATFDLRRDSTHPESLKIEAPRGDGAKLHFLVGVQSPSSNWADVFRVDPKQSTVSKAHELPKLGGRAAFSASHVDGNVYFSRVTADEVTLVSSTSPGVLSRWPRKGIVSAVEQPAPYPVHAASEVVTKSPSSYAVRSAVFFSSGDWALIRNGEMSWQRCESLASIVKAEWAELEGKPTIAEDLEIESDVNFVSAYVHRLTRHMRQIQDLTSIISKLPQSARDWLNGLVGGQQGSVVKNKAFGFERALITVTDNNRLIAVDPSASGKVIWNFKVADFGANEGLNATTVESLNIAYTALMQGLADRLNSLRNPGYMPPPMNHTSAAVTRNLQSVDAYYEIVDGTLQGRRHGSPTWTFLPKEGQKVMRVSAPLAEERVASIGKVLGDRSVLYKYLNSNAVVVIASNRQKGEMSVSVLDAASGSVLYTAEHKGVDVTRPIASVISENWLAYSFTSDPLDSSLSKGYVMGVAELYESDLPNDRGPLGLASNYSATGPSISAVCHKPYVISQTFHLPEEISTMAVSQTTQGITSRQLLVSLSRSNAIVGIPRHMLDPRRPAGRDPTSAQLEEGLTRYQPVMDFDPKIHLNHRNEIFGVRHIMTSPSGMESTSLVFAYGLDIFGTRISPSFAFDILGSSFNKLQLGLTVVALTIGVYVVAPLITRKQTNSLWQSN